MKQKSLIIRIFVLLTYLAMVSTNFLANYLPINNVTSGAVSDAYSNLFAPAGITFSIWGLIYILLGIYVIYQLRSFKKNNLLDQIGIYFIISSIANILWIFSWHYDFIAISLILIISMLLCLIKIANILIKQKKEYFFIILPFNIYFGWITVATIANVIVFLVSTGWNGFGIAQEIWTVLVLFIGASIAIIRTLKDKSIAYGLVFVWAYSGILFKHISSTGFNSQYPIIIATTIICIFLFLANIIFLFLKRTN